MMSSIAGYGSQKLLVFYFMIWSMLRILGVCRNPSNIVRQSKKNKLYKFKIQIFQWSSLVSVKPPFTDSSAMGEGMSGYKPRLV